MLDRENQADTSLEVSLGADRCLRLASCGPAIGTDIASSGGSGASCWRRSRARSPRRIGGVACESSAAATERHAERGRFTRRAAGRDGGPKSLVGQREAVPGCGWRFDVACRCHREPGWLGSSYRVLRGDAWRDAERVAIAVVPAVGRFFRSRCRTAPIPSCSWSVIS